MTWSPKAELAKAAHKIAKKNHPRGYNKAQLIAASKKVNGGFSTDLLKKRVETHEDINNLANHMSEIDGHYPRGMSGCEVVGINGDCGFLCPVFLDGDCQSLGAWEKEDVLFSTELDDEQKEAAILNYFS